ncbi:MAG TPA: class I SAM-dependent methyltransferase [Balneolaceae bacterium]|nr:class I SAM-dependent methyltransferase [Balneolaceae bacterium]
MNKDQYQKVRKTIGYYNRFSNKYDRAYAAYLNHTHQRLLRQIDDISGERILDISCGTGLLAEEFLKYYRDLELVLNDPADEMRAIAEKRVKSKTQAEFSDMLAEELALEPESFNRVICLNSFHYYVDQTAALKKMQNALKPGGSIHILDWNLEGWFHLPNAIISALSQENINTRSVDEAEEMIEATGLKISEKQTWSYRFWKFYLVEAKK